MFSGLIKYGEQKLASHAKKYPRLMAEPTDQERNLVLTISVEVGYVASPTNAL
jgi:hypothetical protein